MKLLFRSALISSMLFSIVSFAQDIEIPRNLPKTKEEFINTEKDLIAIIKWLETTAIGLEKDKRKLANAYVVAWITNTPTVTVNLRASTTKIFDKNPDLLVLYMAGYTRYSLENKYSKDEVMCNVAGIKAAINCYNLGGDIKKDKSLSKVIDADKEGKLEDWVKEAMNSK